MSTISIKGLPSLDGNLLKPLFEYLLKACPKPDEGDDGGDALSHVMFTTDLSVVACDGARWHAVHLPAVDGLEFPDPYAVTRQSLEDFVKLLRAGCSIVGKANRLAVFIDHYPDSEPGLRFIVEREGELWPFTMTRAHFLGPTPRRWVPPVAADAPLLTAEPPRLNGKHLSEATCLDETVARWRQAEEGGPVRIDLTTTVRDIEGQMVTATAVLLPLGQRARLLDQKQKELFARENPGEQPGTSILSLVIDGPKGVERPGGFRSVDEAVDALRPRAGSGIDSVTFTGPDGSSATLVSKENQKLIASLRGAGYVNAAGDLEVALKTGKHVAMAIARAQAANLQNKDIPRRCYPDALDAADGDGKKAKEGKDLGHYEGDQLVPGGLGPKRIRQPTAGGRELRDQLGAPSTKRAPAAPPAPKAAKRDAKAGTKGKGKRS